MSRVLIPTDADWYDELKAVGYYGESDLEREVRQHVRSLFPDFYVFPFKTRIISRLTSQTNKPDLAMVRRDFKAWGVIEVELAEHKAYFATGKIEPDTVKLIKDNLLRVPMALGTI